MIKPDFVRKIPYNSTILIAPLPWGLGHASRCIPLIHQFLKNNCDVIIGCSYEAKSLLALQFPNLKIIPLEGYNIRYSNFKSLFGIKILLQIPGILKSLINEHFQLKKLIKTYNISVVLSDNRPGLFSNTVYSIYITHQLNIKTGNYITGKITNHIHRFFIKKFDECWVPDDQHKPLAGELSSAHNLKNVKYIRPISRFVKHDNQDFKYDIIVVLSGPEPQRTLLENILLKQLATTTYKVFFVRGSHTQPQYLNQNKFVEIVNVMNAEALNEKIEQGNIVICRSGYTSIMDLVKLKKKAILIATPGQTEQEYLATFHHQNGTFLNYDQDDFNLITALKSANNFEWKFPDVNMEDYKIAIKNLIQNQLNDNH